MAYSVYLPDCWLARMATNSMCAQDQGLEEAPVGVSQHSINVHYVEKMDRIGSNIQARVDLNLSW